MIDQPSVATARTVARLAGSRQELLDLFTSDPGQAAPSATERQFPRSRTIRLLMHSRSLRAMAALAAGMLVARPALAWRLLRMLPVGAFARSFLNRILNSTGTHS
jgi:hypothetical protein